MKRYFSVAIFIFLFTGNISAQSVKNVIFMVPDGTSVSNLAFARWYKCHKDATLTTRLAIDPFICGMVKTHSSNAPIGDSAPTMSAYMTGHLSQAKFISMYPPKSANDLLYVDSLRSYYPLMTVMEAARIVRNKAIGVVVTCEFPHATPAGTSSHWDDRNDYITIQQQMVHNSIDVLIGGGAGLLTPKQESLLVKSGYEVYRNDLDKFRNTNHEKLWALFGDRSMDDDWDRDTTKQPSLAEMTQKAISLLSKKKDGFFLMVEGSKIDWASHANDPVGILSEMLAFDAAVKEAIEFAKKDGETLVVICPDHGTGGVSFGNKRSNKDYGTLSLDTIMESLTTKTYIGFTTKGHTGEDVFLAIYHPQNQRLSGLVTAPEINRYLCDAVGINSLDDLTGEYYCVATDLFNEKDFRIESSEQTLKITPRNNKKITLLIEANSNQVSLNKRTFQTKTPALYVGKNGKWYVSKECLEKLKVEN